MKNNDDSINQQFLDIPTIHVDRYRFRAALRLRGSLRKIRIEDLVDVVVEMDAYEKMRQEIAANCN
ncbi:MAG TPA: hypothetical protein VEP90_15245 [Methylomirabilota bacterium]|nr:hypothetical protein [Methylomirabilota bacterium]